MKNRSNVFVWVMLGALLPTILTALCNHGPDAPRAVADGVLPVRGGGTPGGTGGGYDYADGTHNVASTVEIDTGGGYVGDDAHDVYLPAGHAIGQSPAARLLAGSGVTGAVIQTANFGSATGYRALISSLWVDGGRTVNVNSVFTWHEDDPFVASGIRFDSYGGGVYGNYIERCKGWAIEGTRSTAISALGAVGIPMSRYENNEMVRCFGGMKISSGDSFIIGNMCNQVRDHGLWITTGGGSNKVLANHLYGCGAAGSFAESEGTSGCACRCDLTSFFDDNDFSDSDYGMYIAAIADYTTVNNCRIQHNSTYGIYALGTTHINNSFISQNTVGSTGIYFDAGAPRCQVVGGEVQLEAATTKGIQAVGRMCHINNLDLTGSGAAAQIGIEVNAPNLNGQVWHITVYGFTGAGSAALKVLDWGSNNKIYISTDYIESSDVPLSIQSGVWTAGGSSGNSVFVDGVEITSGTHGSFVLPREWQRFRPQRVSTDAGYSLAA